MVRQCATPRGACIDEDADVKELIKRFVMDESGATAIEYGLIAAGISVAILTVLNTVSRDLQSTFSNVSNGVAGAAR